LVANDAFFEARNYMTNTRTKIFSIIIIACIFVCSDLASALQPRCEEAFSRWVTVHDQSLKVRDQCSYGSCWAQASLARIEINARKQSAETPRLSDRFLIYHSLLERAKAAIRKAGDPFDFELIGEGMTIRESDALIKKVGLVPDSVFSDFETKLDQNPRMISALLQSLNELVLSLRSSRLKSLARPTTHADLKQFDANADLMLEQLVEQGIGRPPDSFFFEGRSWTAREFAARPEFRSAEHQVVLDVQRAPRLALAAVKQQLDLGRPVLMVGIDTKIFSNPGTGELTLKAYDSPVAITLRQRARIARSLVDAQSDWHAMLIVGYLESSEGRLETLLVLDSQGEQTADRGFWRMSADYFRVYVAQVQVPSSAVSQSQNVTLVGEK